MNTRPISIICVLFLISSPATHAGPQCNPENEARAAGDIQKQPPTWAALYRSFKLYGSCTNDVEMGETYSDLVARLLTDRWDTPHDLNVLVGKSPPFGNFVLRYVNELMTQEQATRIDENARSHCPKQEVALCKRLIGRMGQWKNSSGG